LAGWLASAKGAAKDVLFAVHAADGATATGPLRKIDADWSVRLGGNRPVLVPGAHVIALRRPGVPLPPPPVAEQVVLSTGERIPLEPGGTLRLAGERLDAAPVAPLRLPADAELKIPVAAVAVVWIAPPEGPEEPAVLLRRLLVERRPRDVVLLRNGDRVEGTVAALDRRADCRLEVAKKPLVVPFARVAAVAFNTELLARPRAKRPYGHLVLTSGARLDVAAARVDAERGRLAGRTLLGAAIDVPLGAVAALNLRQGRAVYLSDLEPRAYEHTPFLGLSWPWVKDGSVAGRDLRLGGSSYDKGLGMHSRARLTYDLGGRYDWFDTLVGLDDRAGRRGRAGVEVVVDGKSQDLGWEGELTARDGPRAVRIDVRQARELTLIVGFGRLGDVAAHVDWAEARLIKSAP
jgi:hypothetical protein